MTSKLKPREILKSDYVKTIIFLAIMILGVMAFWFGLKAVLKTEYPLLAVASPSMTPTLVRGDLIVVQGGLDAPYDEINVGRGPDSNGTIIVFQGEAVGLPDELIVHRAWKKEYNAGVWYFATWGDNNGGPDIGGKTWHQKYLVGRVIGWIPLVGQVPLFVREPFGMIIILVLMLILIFADFLPIWKRKTQPSENTPLSENAHKNPIEETSIIIITTHPRIFLLGNFSFYRDFDK